MRIQKQPDENVIRTIRILAFSCAAALAYIVLSQTFRSDLAPTREETPWSRQVESAQQESPVDLPIPVVPPPPPLPKPASHRPRKAETNKAINPLASRALAVEARSEIAASEEADQRK